MNSTHNTAFK